jgi:hypothetical protein
MSSLVGETIYIFADSDWVASPVFGELHVLDSQSDTLHYAGSTSQYRDISFWLLDPTDDYPTIEAAYRAGSTVTLVDWLGNSTSVKIRDLKITRHLTDIKRPNSNYEVAQCSAKLMKQ